MEIGTHSCWELGLCQKAEQKCHTTQVLASTFYVEFGGTEEPWEMWQHGQQGH